MTDILKTDRNKDGTFVLIVNGVRIENILNEFEFLGAWSALQKWAAAEAKSQKNDGIIIPDCSFSMNPPQLSPENEP